VQVLLSWFWSWLLNARDVRLIIGEASLELETPRPPDFVPTRPDDEIDP
jgi:hypothetical protein